MVWKDRVYGWCRIDDPRVLGIVRTATFERLRGIRQAGPSALAYPFKDVTRHEHSLGVHVLLRRLGADFRECVAGLLHDVSHTAFSHAVDFLHAADNPEQDHHESLKGEFLGRADLAAAIRVAGFEPEDFLDDRRYGLLERPLPELCADRLDYFLRDGLSCGVLDAGEACRILESLTVFEGALAFDDAEVARLAASRFEELNRDWYAGESEAYLYNEFAEALREGLACGALGEADLLGDDAGVLARLRSSGRSGILERLSRVERFAAEPWVARGYVPRVTPKHRWIDPPVAGSGRGSGGA